MSGSWIFEMVCVAYGQRLCVRLDNADKKCTFCFIQYLSNILVKEKGRHQNITTSLPWLHTVMCWKSVRVFSTLSRCTIDHPWSSNNCNVFLQVQEADYQHPVYKFQKFVDLVISLESIPIYVNMDEFAAKMRDTYNLLVWLIARDNICVVS